MWSKPKNLGPVINTAAREYSPRISPDGKWLIFTSERGMQTEHRDQTFTSEEFSSKARSTFNGLGNIYRIPDGLRPTNYDAVVVSMSSLTENHLDGRRAAGSVHCPAKRI